MEMLFVLWTRLDPRKQVRRRAHWRNLAKTTEPSVCGGNAALCQLTLTTCYYIVLRASIQCIAVVRTTLQEICIIYHVRSCIKGPEGTGRQTHGLSAIMLHPTSKFAR